MSKTLTIDDAMARKIYASADPELKAILEDSYGKPFFSLKITDRIRSFEDACEYNNTNSNATRFVVGTRQQRYQERVAEITKALNEGWVPNYDRESQYKFTPWFYLDKPGFRFDGSTYALTDAGTGGGSRFAFKTRELSDYAGKHFLKEYEQWMTTDNAMGGCYMSAGVQRRMFDGDIKSWEAYIIPRIRTFEDACAETGWNPLDYRFQEGTSDEIAYRKYKVICEALNGGWKCDWTNKNQEKWYPWMEYDVATAGFRFDVSRYAYAAAHAGGGSRLRLCSAGLAKHAGTQFADILTLLLL